MTNQHNLNKIWIITCVMIGVFLFNTACAWSFDWERLRVEATPKMSPYTYLQRRPPSRVDFEEMKKKIKPPLVRVAPQVPAVVTEADGTKHYYFNGQRRVSVDPTGYMTFYKEGTAIYKKDSYDGALVEKFEHRGNGLVEVKNEFNEVIGFKQYGYGARRILQELDHDGNPVATYVYGSPLHKVVDELTGTAKMYDEMGRLVEERNFEGYTIARYEYNNRRLSRRIEQTLDSEGNVVDGNITIYDAKGRNPVKIVNPNGWEIVTYTYGERGRLASVINHENDTITNYNERGKPIEVTDLKGNIRKVYEWQGVTKLRWVIDIPTGEVTWFENGKESETTYNSVTLKKWIYVDGKIMGIMDFVSNELTLFDHGRVSRVLYFPETPTIEEVESWIRGNWVE